MTDQNDNKFKFHIPLPEYIGEDYIVDLTECYSKLREDPTKCIYPLPVLGKTWWKLRYDFIKKKDDQFTDVAYILDTIMIAHRINMSEEDINNNSNDYNLSNLRENYLELYQIVSSKWYAFVATVFLMALERVIMVQLKY